MISDVARWIRRRFQNQKLGYHNTGNKLIIAVPVAANDRAPTSQELQKLVEFPDRRIKPIIYTMISSG